MALSKFPLIWESETMTAYRSPREIEQIKEEKAKRIAEKKAQRIRGSSAWRSRSQRKIKQQAAKTTGWVDDDWVFVERGGNAVTIANDKKSVFVLPSDSKNRKTGASKESSKGKKGQLPSNLAPQVTRELSDTKFNWVFQKPLPHTYGRMNTKPSNEKNYMKTFNMKAAIGQKNQVYENTLRANEFQTLLHDHNFNIEECLDELAAETKPPKDESEEIKTQELKTQDQIELIAASQESSQITEGVKRIEPIESTVNHQTFAFKPSTACQLPYGFTFGKPSVDRRTQPTMFDILSWPEPLAT